MYILSMILLIFFAIIGLCAFVTAIMELGCRGGGKAVLILRELKADNAEMRIRSATQICRKNRDIRLICVCEKDSAAAEIAGMMQTEYPCIEIMTSGELKEQF